MRKMSDYLNGTQAAEVLGISLFRLRAWTKRGAIKHTVSPATGKPLYAKEDLEAFLNGVNEDRS